MDVHEFELNLLQLFANDILVSFERVKVELLEPLHIVLDLRFQIVRTMAQEYAHSSTLRGPIVWRVEQGLVLKLALNSEGF